MQAYTEIQCTFRNTQGREDELQEAHLPERPASSARPALLNAADPRVTSRSASFCAAPSVGSSAGPSNCSSSHLWGAEREQTSLAVSAAMAGWNLLLRSRDSCHAAHHWL